MDHYASARPYLPGSTPAPAPHGKRSVYAGNKTPATELSKTQATNDPSNQQTVSRKDPKQLSNIGRQLACQEKAINKMVSRLPYELRESVNSVVVMAIRTAENIQKDLEVSKQEALTLRHDLHNKNHELLTLQKYCETYQIKIKGLEGNVDNLKDNVHTSQNFNSKNRTAISKLASTNRMLINALEALKTTDEHVLQGNNLPPRPGRLEPLDSKPDTFRPPQPHDEGGQGGDGQIPLFQKDQLRESLLRVSREHYKSMKNAEVLEMKVTELKASLKSVENLNRKYKAEIEDMRLLHDTDAKPIDDKIVSSEIPTVSKNKNFGAIDDRLKSLLDRNMMDLTDGVLHLRRVLAHMATAPNNLNPLDAIKHMLSKESLKIFESDMICLYLTKPDQRHLVQKYTVRSHKPVTYDTREQNALSFDVISSGKLARVNALSQSNVFDLAIDGCPGVVTKRILSLPVSSGDTGEVIGCVSFINKGTNELFGEVEELFGMIFADQVSYLITACMAHSYLNERAHLLQHLLESSLALFNVAPDPDSLQEQKGLSPGELLYTLENSARELFKCQSARAFLISDFINMDPKSVVFLDSHNNKPSVSMDVRLSSLSTLPMHSGIVGHVISTMVSYCVEENGYDPFMNPAVDIDPINSPMITAPIIGLNGTVVAVLQLVAGVNSPKMRPSDESVDSRILFPDAVNWLVHQLAAPLQFLLSNIGRPVKRPASTPATMVRPGTGTVSRGVTPATATSSKLPMKDLTVEDFMFLSANGVPASGKTVQFNETQAAAGGSGGGGEISLVEHNRVLSSLEESNNQVAEINAELDIQAARFQEERIQFAKEKAKLRGELDEQKNALVENTVDMQRMQDELQHLQHQVNSLRMEKADLAKGQEGDAVEQLKRLVAAQTELDRAMVANAASEAKAGEAQAEVTELKRQIIVNQNAAAAENEVLQQEISRLRKELSSSSKEPSKSTEVGVEATSTKENHDARTVQQEANATLQQEIEDLKSQLAVAQAMTSSSSAEDETSSLRQEVDALKSQLTAAQENSADLYNSTALQQEIEDLKSQLAVAQAMTSSSSAEDETSSLRQEVDELKSQLTAAQENSADLYNSTALQQEIEDLKSQLAVAQNLHKGSESQVLAVSAQLQEEMLKHEASQAQLQERIAELEADLMKKNELQAILQGQLVKMAGNQLQDIDGMMRPRKDETLIGSAASGSARSTAAGVVPAGRPGSVPTGPRPTTKGRPPSTPSGKPPSRPSSGSKSRPVTTGAASVDAVVKDWVQLSDEEGHVYYYNEVTGVSSWTDPALGLNEGSTESGEIRGDWAQQWDPNGVEYWVHQVTGESAWEIPADDEASVGSTAPADRALASAFSANAGGYTIEL